MRKLLGLLLCLPWLALSQDLPPSPALETLVRSTAELAVKQFSAPVNAQALTSDKIALTVIDLKDSAHPKMGSYRGSVPVYPASVVKLFYLTAVEAGMESGKIAQSAELDRAIHDMVVDSVNEATALVFDTLTGTTSGPELDAAALAAWQAKRNIVNEYFAHLGYTGINVNQKTFAEGPYGRERQGRGPQFENNNRLTTDATAHLMFQIATHRIVTPARCTAMMNLMHRDYSGSSKNPDDQAHGFSGSALPSGAQYYSKAGWTSTVRHDATYVELPNGARYVAVIFTTDNARRTEIIPFVAKRIAEFFER